MGLYFEQQIFFQGEHDKGNIVGLNQHTGEPVDPQMEGIFDNYAVKCQIINSGYAKDTIVFCALATLIMIPSIQRPWLKHLGSIVILSLLMFFGIC